MGCVSSKLVKREVREKEERESGGTHVVSLTSSTFGLLKLDESPDKNPKEEPIEGKIGEIEKKRTPPRESLEKKTSPRESFEVINTWELMNGLDDEEEVVPESNLNKKSPKTRPFLQIPMKNFNQMASPKRGKNSCGKENKGLYNGYNFSPKPRCVNSAPNLRKRAKSDEKIHLSRGDSSKRKSLSPLFGNLNSKNDSPILDSYEKKCPRGGENSVVIYTTTLRGIRNTFEDCNKVRSAIESHEVHILERDVSMDKSFKEELRGLMGTKEVKVPVVFIKGRLIGGVDVVIKLEEEGKLGILLEGIPSAEATCCRCGGARFVMCLGCHGSCKVLSEDKKKKMKCGKCNENGLIQCPICC